MFGRSYRKSVFLKEIIYYAYLVKINLFISHLLDEIFLKFFVFCALKILKLSFHLELN